jgi:intracellular multiplication protein IcmL
MEKPSSVFLAHDENFIPDTHLSLLDTGISSPESMRRVGNFLHSYQELKSKTQPKKPLTVSTFEFFILAEVEKLREKERLRIAEGNYYVPKEHSDEEFERLWNNTSSPSKKAKPPDRSSEEDINSPKKPLKKAFALVASLLTSFLKRGAAKKEPKLLDRELKPQDSLSPEGTTNPSSKKSALNSLSPARTAKSSRSKSTSKSSNPKSALKSPQIHKNSGLFVEEELLARKIPEEGPPEEGPKDVGENVDFQKIMESAATALPQKTSTRAKGARAEKTPKLSVATTNTLAPSITPQPSAAKTAPAIPPLKVPSKSKATPKSPKPSAATQSDSSPPLARERNQDNPLGSVPSDLGETEKSIKAPPKRGRLTLISKLNSSETTLQSNNARQGETPSVEGSQDNFKTLENQKNTPKTEMEALEGTKKTPPKGNGLASGTEKFPKNNSRLSGATQEIATGQILKKSLGEANSLDTSNTAKGLASSNTARALAVSLGASNRAKDKAHKIDSLPFASGGEIVMSSRQWYISQSRQLWNIVKFLFPLTLLLVVIVGFLLIRGEKVRYFSVTPDLRVLEMESLEEPYINSQGLLNWVGDVITRAMSLDFLQWKRKLMDLRSEFDSQGYQSFVKSLETGGHIEKIVTERLNLSTVLSEAPVIVSQGVLKGKMTWKIEMPIIVTYQSSNGVEATQKLLAEIIVERVNPAVNPKGVVIRQLILGKVT